MRNKRELNQFNRIGLIMDYADCREIGGNVLVRELRRARNFR
jgi:hypothetical protein